MYKKIFLASTLLIAATTTFAQNFDSTGLNRLFVPPTPPLSQPTTEVPGYGTYLDGAVVKNYEGRLDRDPYCYAEGHSPLHLCIAKNGGPGYSFRPYPSANLIYVCPANTYIQIVSAGLPVSCDQGGQ